MGGLFPVTNQSFCEGTVTSFWPMEPAAGACLWLNRSEPGQGHCVPKLLSAGYVCGWQMLLYLSGFFVLCMIDIS